jgi:hypothetical protein
VDKEEDEHDARPGTILACPEDYISQIGIATCSVHVLAVLTYDWSSQSVDQQTSADAAIDGSCVEGNSKIGE